MQTAKPSVVKVDSVDINLRLLDHFDDVCEVFVSLCVGLGYAHLLLLLRIFSFTQNRL